MLKNWFKIAFKNYRKNGVSTLINLFGLTIGLTGFMLILLHWNDEASYEAWNPDNENIYLVENYMNEEMGTWSVVPYPQLSMAKEEIPEVEDFLLINSMNGDAKISYGEKAIFPEFLATSESFFEFFPFELKAGSYKDVIADNNSIAMSEKMAQNLFGDNYAKHIGEKVKVDELELILKAVYKLTEANSEFLPDIVFRSFMLNNNKERWGNFNFSGFIKVKSGSNPRKIEELMTKTIFEQRVKIPAEKEGMTVDEWLNGEEYTSKVLLTRLDKVHLEKKGMGFGDQYNPELKRNLLVLLSLSLIILFLSAINFINLKAAQASQRAKEVGVRKSLGATRNNVIWQFMSETFLICLVAFGFSLLLVEVLLPTYSKFLNKTLHFHEPKFYLYAIAVLFIVSFLSGIIPALYLSNFKPINTLKGNFSRSKHGIWLRNGILVTQLIISSFFVICSIIVHLQVNYMLNKDLGFKGDQSIVIQFKKNDRKPNIKYKQAKRALLNIRGVKDVTYSQQNFGKPTYGSSTAHFEEKEIQSEHGAIDINFIDYYNIPLVAGRDFNEKLSSDTLTSTIVNQAFVRQAGLSDKEIIGRKLSSMDTIDYEIIGVTQDFNMHNANDKVEPIVLVNYDRTWMRSNMNNIQVKLDKNDIEGTLQRVKKYWQETVEQGYPIQYSFVNKDYEKTFEKFTKQRTLFTILNTLVLIVALLGLFALSALLIEQRLKTVAIKKTLGASDGALIFGLTKQFLIITAIAVLISIPISYYFMNEWLKDFAYRIEMPWWPYVLSLAILLVLTFVVVSFKAYRATKISLVKYLKYE